MVCWNHVSRNKINGCNCISVCGCTINCINDATLLFLFLSGLTTFYYFIIYLIDSTFNIKEVLLLSDAWL